MIGKISSGAWVGIDGYIVTCECDLSGGLPAFDIVGLPDTAVKEARERVRSAIKNCGYKFPQSRITINLAPAQIKKSGTMYDLPIFLGLLATSEQIKLDPHHSLYIGELSLDGKLRPVNGVLPIVVAARDAGFERLYLPKENAYEAAVVPGITVFGISCVKELIAHFDGTAPLTPQEVTVFAPTVDPTLDYLDVVGQDMAIRAITIAACGGHNMLMVGPPGSGKSMLARRLPSILPDIAYEEALESTKIYSVLGGLNNNEPIVTRRPFRSPHHTTSASAMVGGAGMRPGEISMAHNGVLFLDELPEFHSDVLEVMRQPLEDGVVTVSRAAGTVTYPSRFMLVCAMNPCKCGYFGFDENRCSCTDSAIRKYTRKLSGPLLDRIDIYIPVSPVDYERLSARQGTSSSQDLRDAVNRGRAVQSQRYKDRPYNCNAHLTPGDMKEFCRLTPEAEELLQAAFERLGLSARGYDKVLKVARTIGDLDGSEVIQAAHLAEAVQYRSFEHEI